MVRMLEASKQIVVREHAVPGRSALRRPMRGQRTKNAELVEEGWSSGWRKAGAVGEGRVEQCVEEGWSSVWRKAGAVGGGKLEQWEEEGWSSGWRKVWRQRVGRPVPLQGLQHSGHHRGQEVKKGHLVGH